MTASLPPSIKFQPLVGGLPLPGGKVKFYLAGTNTPQAVYDEDGTTPIGTELTLDADGSADFRLGDGISYKIVLTDSDDVPVPGWTLDRVRGEEANAHRVQFNYADTYASGTIGKWLKDLATGTGATFLGYLSPLTGAVVRTLAQVLGDLNPPVTLFGADKTGVLDSTAAFIAARGACAFPRIPEGVYKLVGSVAFDSSSNDGKRFVGAGPDKVAINYTGNDYPFIWNSTDSGPNVVRRSGISGATIVGTAAALGALKIHASSENIFEDLYLTGFTNPLAKVVYSDSVLDYAWGGTFRNVTAKHNEGCLASWWLNRYTWTLLDHCYASNGGTYAMVIGSGVSMTLLNPAIESHTRGIVLTTGLAAGPISGLTIINPNLESLGTGIDINNITDAPAGIAPGSEYVYSVNIYNPLFGGITAPASDCPIRIGKARFTSIIGGFLYSPNTAANALLDILANAEDTRVQNTYFSANGGHADIANAGLRTCITRPATTYTPTWTTASTQPVLGDGTLSGKYWMEGNLCTVQITLIAGSTTTFGTNTWRFALPVPVGGSARALGQCFVRDNSTGTTWPATASADNGALFLTIPAAKDAGFGVDLNNPMTWAVSDRLDIQMTYPMS